MTYSHPPLATPHAYTMAAIIDNHTIPYSIAISNVESNRVSKLWPAILYASLMMLVSFVGNSIVCYVYGFRWHSTVTKIFIFWLAAMDLTNSLICMPTEIAMLVRIVSFDAPAWCKIVRFLTYTLNGSSAFILVVIALDRWFKICRPLQRFFTLKRARWTCLGSVVLTAFISWPSLVLYGNLTLPVLGTNAMGVTCMVSDHFINTWWPFVFFSVQISFFLLIVVVITVLYSLIAVKVVQLKDKQLERLTQCHQLSKPSSPKNYTLSTKVNIEEQTSEFSSGGLYPIDCVLTKDTEATENDTHIDTPVQILQDGRSRDKKRTQPKKGTSKKSREVFSKTIGCNSSCKDMTLQRSVHVNREPGQEIHFTAYSDLTQQGSLTVHPIRADCSPPVTNDDSICCSRDSNVGVMWEANGSTSWPLSARPSIRGTKSCSGSVNMLYSAPLREAVNERSTIHQSSSDAILVLQKSPPLFSSLKADPVGHPPTSSLHTPTPLGSKAKQPPNGKLLQKRLHKKMAYRPAKTTRMLFAISIVFVVSFLPLFCITMIRSVQRMNFFLGLTDADILAVCIFIRSHFISNACNPIIYGICNQNFIDECRFLYQHFCSTVTKSAHDMLRLRRNK